VQRGKSFSQGTPTTRVFIRNIPKGVTEAQVRELCIPYGQITWLSVHSDSVKSSSKTPRRNIAFVNYTTVEEARTAADALHATRPFLTSVCDEANGSGDAQQTPPEEIVPILTKVVVENLPTKTTRKERRSTTTALPAAAADNTAPPAIVVEQQQPAGPPVNLKKLRNTHDHTKVSRAGDNVDVSRFTKDANVETSPGKQAQVPTKKKSNEGGNHRTSTAAAVPQVNRGRKHNVHHGSPAQLPQAPTVKVSVGCIPPPPPPYQHPVPMNNMATTATVVGVRHVVVASTQPPFPFQMSTAGHPPPTATGIRYTPVIILPQR
jgi:hypothetical protein